jgi:ABC-2 type transport system permease protein
MLLDVALKDLRRSLSKPFNLVMMLGAPFLITGLIYFAFGGLGSGQEEFTLQPVTTVISNQDQGSTAFNAGAQLEQFLLDESVADILDPSTVQEEAAARALVDEQQADVAVLIPPDFSEKALSGRDSADVVLYQDPTLTLAPAILKDLISQFTDGFAGATIATTVVQKQFAEHSLELSQQELEGVAMAYAGSLQAGGHEHGQGTASGLQVRSVEGSNSAQDMSGFIAPVMASMMIFFVFFMGANGAESIIVESEEGTLARLFTTPNSRAMILGGKLLAVVFTLILQTLALIGAAALLFGINWGDPLPVFLTSLAMIVAAGGFGVMLMSFLETTRQTGPVLGGVLTVTGMLGGLFTTGVPDMPAAFDKVSLSMPQGWALQAWKVTLGGAPLNEVIVPAVVLVALGLGFFAIGAIFFRRRFA